MKSKELWIGVVIIVVLVIGGLILMESGDKNANNKTNTSNTTSASKEEDKSSDSSALSNAVATTDVSIENYEFTPAVIKVKVGDTVTWTNKDQVRHDVVSSDASPDAPSSPLLAKGESYEFTFKKAGTYTLHCSPHPYMHQIVQVTE